MKPSPISVVRDPEGWLPKIEPGIPIPRKTGARSSLALHLERMDVDDSILVPHTRARRAIAVARGVRARLGRTFITRKLPEGVRIWRTK